MVAPVVASPSRAMVAREVRRQEIRQAEKRQTDVSGTIAASYSGIIINLLNNLIIGDEEENQFQGNKITPTGITLRYRCIVADATNLMRVILVQGTQGQMPTEAQLLTSVGNIRTPLSSFSINFHGNVRVLHDKLYYMDTEHPHRYPKDKDNNWKTIYISAKKLQKITLATGSAIYQGALFLYCYSDSSIVAHPSVEYYSSVKYIA